MFAVLQNRRLNQHLAYTILDEVRVFLVRQLAISHHHLALSSVGCLVIPGGIFMKIFVYSARHFIIIFMLFIIRGSLIPESQRTTKDKSINATVRLDNMN